MKTAFIFLFISLAFGFAFPSQSFTKRIYSHTTIVTENGYMRTITNYKDGKKQGQETSILNNGDTIETVQYKDGKYDGKAEAFYEGNRIGTIRYFKDDYKVGEWLHFDTAGNLKTKTIFDKPFERNDPRWSGKETFYEENKPIFAQIWKEGRRSSVIVHNDVLYKSFQAKDISLGTKLFNEECAACHTVQHDLVGPALAEPVNSRKQEWLISFIRNADSLYKAGDIPTNALYKKYNEIKHPGFAYLTQNDIDAILKYVREKK